MGSTITEIECEQCPECSHETLPGAHFCTRCGTSLDALRASRSAVDSERLAQEDEGRIFRSTGAFGAVVTPPEPQRPAPEATAPAVAPAMEIRLEDVDEGFDFGGSDPAELVPPSPPSSARAARVERAAPPPPPIPPPLPRSGMGPAAHGTQHAEANESRPNNPVPVTHNEGTSSMPDYSREEVLRRVRLKQSLKRVGLAGIDLSGANLEGVDFSRADLDGANLRDANLKNANLQSASLRQAILEGADLSNARLHKADLEGARLAGATLDKAELSLAEFVEADLQHAKLRGARLTSANLEEADLSDAILDDAELRGAQAAGTTFARASLCRANLGRADLAVADFTKADLRGADFRESTASGAIVTGARVSRGAFARARLDEPLEASWIRGVSDAAGDGAESMEERLDGMAALRFLTAEDESAAQEANGTRYFGKGDVLRNATLEFGAGSKIHVDSRFENCAIALGEDAELVIGESGVLRDCQILGHGSIVVNGCFFERQSPGIAGPKSLVVSARGMLKGAVEQAPDSTVFAFEAGCRLRVKILPPSAQPTAEAAE